MGFVLLLLALGMYTLSAMNRPLGPPLELVVSEDAEAKEQPAVEPRTVSLQTQKTCGNSGVMNLLVIGLPLPNHTIHQGLGSLRLVTVDFDNTTATITSLPRDNVIEGASISQIYINEREEAKGNPDNVIHRKATQSLAQVIVDEFNFVPDHYITLNPSPFVDLVDEIGGINIDIPEDVSNIIQEDIDPFEAGENQNLDGQQTLDYARLFQDPSISDSTRFDRQKQVIIAICEALIKPSNWSKIDDLIKDARKMIITDLSVDQARDLACMAELVGESVQFEEFIIP